MISTDTIPVCHIQHDFEQCLAEEIEGGQFYINVDKSADEVEEFTVKFSANGAEFDAGEGGMFKKVDDHLYEAVLGRTLNRGGSDLDEERCMFQTMERDYTIDSAQDDDEEVQWTAVDTIGVPEEHLALGNAKGDLRIYDGGLELNQEIKGAHLSDVTSLRFFPSGEVLLSSSTDMQVKIWSVVDGSNPRTFAEHKSAVTDTCLIDRGRNFLSSSTDGTIRLWECGSGETLHVFSRKENFTDGVNSMALFADGTFEDGPHRLEFGTQGKHVVAGHTSGVITIHDIFSKEQEGQLPSIFSSSCNAVALDTKSKNLVYAGYQNGALAQWDLRNTSKPIDYVYINEGTPINSIHSQAGSLYVSSGLDTSLKLDVTSSGQDTTTQRMLSRRATFLVSNDYKVAQYTSSPDEKHIIAVGNWGFCAKYSAI